jgi:hypothetical protein
MVATAAIARPARGKPQAGDPQEISEGRLHPQAPLARVVQPLEISWRAEHPEVVAAVDRAIAIAAELMVDQPLFTVKPGIDSRSGMCSRVCHSMYSV